MIAYAIAVLRDVRFGPDVVRYLETIDATLAPFGGRFVVHGGEKIVLEGDMAGEVVVISFPSRERALAWYQSPAYQSILPLRMDSASGPVVLVDGVSADHRATDIMS